MENAVVKEQLGKLPAKPGVYQMRDATGGILYVGKAVNLRSRVRSYFTTRQKLTPKLAQMVGRLAFIDYYVVPSETEALVLELNLIQKHKPHYNVRLKDDKGF
ncbi:GIY-YIG nuclease family protein, partial [Chloroflexota bacterium]